MSFILDRPVVTQDIRIELPRQELMWRQMDSYIKSTAEYAIRDYWENFQRDPKTVELIRGMVQRQIEAQIEGCIEALIRQKVQAELAQISEDLERVATLAVRTAFAARLTKMAKSADAAIEELASLDTGGKTQ